MGNRIYLCCTEFSSMPQESQWQAFFESSGVEYEASGHLPLLWLVLFDEICIKINAADRNGFSGDERAYAYLLGDKNQCLERIEKFRRIASQHPPTPATTILNEWIERLRKEPYPYIIVRTEELDWMGAEGELEKEMRKAVLHLNESLARSEFRLSNAVRYLTGLSELDEFYTSEPIWLVGCANGAMEWPARAAAQDEKQAQEHSKNRKPWWGFWRKK